MLHTRLSAVAVGVAAILLVALVSFPGCDWVTSGASEGDYCSTEGDHGCDGTQVLVCEYEEWAAYTECRTTETCVIHDVPDSGRDYFCVAPDGTGDYCGDVLKWTQTCVGNMIQRCDGRQWEHYSDCTTTQTCVDRTLVDDYGHATQQSFCVNPDGTGDYCGEIAQWTQRCNGLQTQRCNGTIWEDYGDCTTSQQCVERQLTDQYGETSQQTFCVNGDGSGDSCATEAKWTSRCNGSVVLRCNGSIWEAYDECTLDEQCVESTETDEYGNVSQVANCQ